MGSKRNLTGISSRAGLALIVLRAHGGKLPVLIRIQLLANSLPHLLANGFKLRLDALVKPAELLVGFIQNGLNPYPLLIGEVEPAL